MRIRRALKGLHLQTAGAIYTTSRGMCDIPDGAHVADIPTYNAIILYGL